MKIALVNDSTTYWLAGEVGVDERVHSSASGLRINGDIALDFLDAVRGQNRQWFDRGNLSAEVSFATWRKFSALAEAEEFWAVYDIVWPRTGALDLYGADGIVVARLNNAVVKPPAREVIGVSVKLDYTVVGGAWLVPDGADGFEPPAILMGGETVVMPNP